MGCTRGQLQSICTEAQPGRASDPLLPTLIHRILPAGDYTPVQNSFAAGSGSRNDPGIPCISACFRGHSIFTEWSLWRPAAITVATRAVPAQ